MMKVFLDQEQKITEMEDLSRGLETGNPHDL